MEQVIKRIKLEIKELAQLEVINNQLFTELDQKLTEVLKEQQMAKFFEVMKLYAQVVEIKGKQHG